MRTSEAINEIAAALAAVQSKIPPASKDGTGNYGKYTSLASVWDACRKPLGEHDLAVIQSPAYVDGWVIVTTRLLHKSGQWIESELMIKPTQPTAQAIGSAITYARRYALASLIGVVADDDDDGKEASKPPNGNQAAAKPKGAQEQKPRTQEPPRPPANPGPVYTAKDAAFVGWLDGELVKQGKQAFKAKVLEIMEGKPHLENHDKAVADALRKAMDLEG